MSARAPLIVALIAALLSLVACAPPNPADPSRSYSQQSAPDRGRGDGGGGMM